MQYETIVKNIVEKYLGQNKIMRKES